MADHQSQNLIGELEKVRQEVVRLERENACLRERMRLLLLMKFGRKSETLSTAQLLLLNEEPAVSAEEVELESERPAVTPKEQTKSKHPGREELPKHLRREEQIVTVQGAERLCPHCQKECTCFGYEEKEVLDVIPAEYFVRVIKREKLACKHCGNGPVKTAPPAGPKIIEKGKLSDAVVVDVVIKKYCDHLPLYRQSGGFERDHQIDLSRKTLSDTVQRAGFLLEAISRAMKQDLLAGGYIQADETTVGVQSEKVQDRNHQGYQFQYSRPGGPVVFDFQMSRGRAGPREFLKTYNGILQYDGYAAYDKVGGKDVVRVGCWAHARRKFNDVLKVDETNEDAAAMVGLIRKLYAIESQAREANLSSEARRQLRQDKSKPLLSQIRQQALAIQARALPGGSLGRACQYMLGQWSKLERYVDHGAAEIDNNWCENGMRPVVLGRKNWLHIGSENAAPKIAAIQSVTETCKRLKVPLRDYLLDVLPRLAEWPASRVGELTPMTWNARRSARS